MPGAREVLQFNDLSPYLMLKNGNYLYKVPFRDGWAVLKVYYGSKGFWGNVKKSFGNVVMQGQTSYMPKTRCRIETECIELWRKHGFRTFEIYDIDVQAPTCVPGGYRLVEYVEAPELYEYMADESVPEEERFALYRRWLPEWSRRHEIAIRERDTRLVHENGDGGHVKLVGDEFVWFDFEMVYRYNSMVRQCVSHEIIQYIWHLYRHSRPHLRPRLIEETVAHYPNRERLLEAYDYYYHHPNPIMRTARELERRFRKKAQKPTSKHNITHLLKEQLDRA